MTTRTVDDLDGNLHEVAEWYDNLGEPNMESEYAALKKEILSMSLNENDVGEQKRLLKIGMVMMVDIAQSLDALASNP